MLALVVMLACASSEPSHEGHAAHGGMPPPPAAVEIAPETVRRLDIRVEEASVDDRVVARRAPATVTWDPEGVTSLNAQAGGQIRELSLPLPGVLVQRGDPVARLYQPEIRAAFEELRVAAGLGEPWRTAARARLLAAGVAAGEVDAALRSGRTPDTYTVRSPVTGVVLERPEREGAWLAPGGRIGVLADRAATVAELVVTGAPPAPGTPIALRDPATGESWPATVISTLPTAELAGIRVRVRPHSPPPVGRPLVAEWSLPSAGGVWVAASSVVDTGERRVAFVRVGEGRYEPRTVVLGERADDRIQILDGLSEGDEVVVSGAFLLDSETQIGAMSHAGHGS